MPVDRNMMHDIIGVMSIKDNPENPAQTAGDLVFLLNPRLSVDGIYAIQLQDEGVHAMQVVHSTSGYRIFKRTPADGLRYFRQGDPSCNILGLIACPENPGTWEEL